MTYGKIIDLRFGLEIRNLIFKTAYLSVTSTIDSSSSSTSIGITSLGVLEESEKIPSSDTSLINDCPENAITAITTANPATTAPTKILGFNSKLWLKHILNVDNYYIEKALVKLMQYFEAVRIGKERAGKSQMKIFNIAGFGMLTIATKKVDGKFVPVGEQDQAAVIQTPDGFAAILVDEDGITKAQSKYVEKNEAMDIFKKLIESGIPEFKGDGVEIWAQKYPTVQND